MIHHNLLSDEEVRTQIARGTIVFGGNARLKIYGTLACHSGKRMQKQNRVFFSIESEAISSGYRPCGHCMREAHKVWRSHLIAIGMNLEGVTLYSV